LAKSKKLVNKQDPILNVIRQSYQQHLASHKTPKIIDVALSGGCDSMVLLHALHQLRGEFNFKVHAIHVHHSISPNADKWLTFCEEECKKNNVPFSAKKINIESEKKLGVEGAARKLRYEALETLKAGTLTTAHHQNDQAETLLLQLIRGSGLKGLASMPHYDDKRDLWKPLLNADRQSIDDYAKENHVGFIEDESNLDTRYDRNFLRQEIFPILTERFPHLIKTLSRSVEHIAEGLNLTETIAKEDAKNFFSEDKTRLSLSMIKGLPKDRIINLTRWWLDQNQLKMPSKKTTDELYQQIVTIKKDASILIKVSEGISVRAFKEELWLVKSEELSDPFEIIWRGEESVTLPDQSRLIFHPLKGVGFSLQKIGVKVLRIQNRVGGERFKPKPTQPTRTLKYLLQNSNIPPWKRDQIPLIFSEDQLVAVPNFGVHFEYHTEPNEHGYAVEWITKKL